MSDTDTDADESSGNQVNKTHESLKLVALVIVTVILFIFIFASASSWILFIKTALPCIKNSCTPEKKFAIQAYAYFALVVTVFTLLIAVLFTFVTRKSKRKLPIDFSSVMKNLTKETKAYEKKIDNKIANAPQPFTLSMKNGALA
jgi:hypothetical protein